MHDREGEETDYREADEEGGGAAGGEGTAGTNEETRPYYTGESHHAEVPGLESAGESAVGVHGLILSVGCRNNIFGNGGGFRCAVLVVELSIEGHGENVQREY